MRILVTGASGFIGRHLVRALLREGHAVTACGRHRETFLARFPEVSFIHADFAMDRHPSIWLPRLRDIDAVINAVGIFREQGNRTYRAIHTEAPAALFDACVQANVRRVIQISALGADEHATTHFHLSKKSADDRLATLDLDWVIVQPSLVYGAGGSSARLFSALASLPLIPLPGSGKQQVQPIHVSDLVDAVIRLLRPTAPHRRRIPCVGPTSMSLRDYLSKLRMALQLRRPRFLPLPFSLLRIMARARELFPGALLTRDALAMLERGNTAEADSITALLGRAPRGVLDFIDTDSAPSVRRDAQLQWLLPLLRFSVAFVWIMSGLVSFGIYPVEHSYALLARVGIDSAWAPSVLYGAALLDLAIGIAIFVLRRRRWLWIAQLILIVGYSLIIAVALPEFLSHPFGPLTKNVPMLIAIVALLVLEE